MARHPVLERRIGHRFQDPALLAQALTHRSFGSPHYERLEFLGDSVLGCAVTELLFQRHPELSEGKLSRMRAGLIREESLARIAREIGIAAFLQLDESTARNEGADRPSILADALEAVYGAVFLDGGYGAAREVIARTFGTSLSQLDPESVEKDAKTRLQEYLQGKRRAKPQYRVVSTSGAKQSLTFEVECLVEDLALKASGSGSSRQRAEQQAAGNLLVLLGS
ncbi:MAG: ribonuclease III [Candidatus Parcubacteria bacterium]|nr:ribonuclease III [Burkholderiales bacterium]